MMTTIGRRRLLGLAALAAPPLCLRAQGPASYPAARPVRIIASQPPGGAFDMIARAVADGMTRTWGTPAFVENRTGAGGLIGVAAAARAAPDGHTFVIGSTGPFAVSPSLVKDLRFDPVKDFTPVGRIVTMPSYLVVNANVPVKDMREFLAYARANPGKLSYASTGNGLSQHTNVELLKSMANLFIVPITFRGSGPAVTALLGQQVDLMIELGPQVIPHIKAGRLKVLATTSAKRTQAMPDVPTLAESGVPGFEAFTWFGLYAPAGTPQAAIDAAHAALVKTFDDPQAKQRMAAIGAEVALSRPQELAAFQASETRKWAAVIRSAGIKPE
jgi:tripartite-type tricarboxylate transporter receptor subunit TctC